MGTTILSGYLFLMWSHLQLWELYCITTVVFEMILWRTMIMGRQVWRRKDVGCNETIATVLEHPVSSLSSPLPSDWDLTSIAVALSG